MADEITNTTLKLTFAVKDKDGKVSFTDVLKGQKTYALTTKGEGFAENFKGFNAAAQAPDPFDIPMPGYAGKTIDREDFEALLKSKPPERKDFKVSADFTVAIEEHTKKHTTLEKRLLDAATSAIDPNGNEVLPELREKISMEHTSLKRFSNILQSNHQLIDALHAAINSVDNAPQQEGNLQIPAKRRDLQPTTPSFV